MPISLLLLLVVLVVGALIGALGIGGVVLVPALKYLGGIPVHTAIPACMLSYLVTGAVGSVVFARYGSLDLRVAGKLCAGALPGAFGGALLLPLVPAASLELAIAALILFSAVNALRSNADPATANQQRGMALFIIGLATGIGSALTGTGGPVLLIPILMWRRVPVLTAIGLSQAVQIPISLSATLGNVIHGQLDLVLSLTLAAALGVGAVIGARLAHRVPVGHLKKAVVVLMVGIGLLMLYDLLAGT